MDHDSKIAEVSTYTLVTVQKPRYFLVLPGNVLIFISDVNLFIAKYVTKVKHNYLHNQQIFYFRRYFCALNEQCVLFI